MKKKNIFIGFGIIFALCLSEIFLRLFFPQETMRNLVSVYDFPCYKAKPYHWNGLLPSANCLMHSNLNAFPDTIVKTNSLGMRDKEILFEKPKGTIRILFLGDSFTMGVGVSEENSYPMLVEGILQKKFPQKNIEVLNAGVPATGIGYQYLFLINEGLKFSPDIVVSGFHPYSDILTESYNSSWDLVDQMGLPKKISSNITYIDTTTHEIFPKNIPLSLKNPIVRNSHLLSFLYNSIQPVKIVLDSKEIYKNILCYHNFNCNDLSTARAKIEKLFEGIKKITNKNNIKLLVVNKPPEYKVYNDQKTRLKYGILLTLNSDDIKVSNRIFDEYFTDEEIDYIDLLPIFLQNKDQKLYFEYDEHFTEVGNKVVAKVIAEKLEEYIEGDSFD